MPTGIYPDKKLVVDRPAGEDRRSKPSIQVYKSGPFFDVFINDVPSGKVMKLHDAYVTESMGDCSGRCIRLPQCIIVLTEEETINCLWELHADDERRADDAGFKASPYANRSDYDKAKAKATT